MNKHYHIGVRFFNSNSGVYVYRVPLSSNVKVHKGDLVVVPPNLVRSTPALATVERVDFSYKEKPSINYVEILGVSKL